MPALRLLFVAALALSNSCSSENQSSVEPLDIRNLVIPATETNGEKLVDVLANLNSKLKALYPDHSKLPLIIERHENPKYDLGDQEVDFNLPEQTLIERVQVLSQGTLTHWKRTESGFIIFRTWHRPQYSFDNEPAITKGSEQNAAEQPATRLQSKSK